MAATVSSVEINSPAEKMGIKKGDTIIAIGGENLVDAIDYAYLTATRRISIDIIRNGTCLTLNGTKDETQPLGLVFEGDLTARRQCINNCAFCFVAQLPEGMRESLYFKDDDWRLSLMMGNYITLTNVSDAEMQRIVRRHASPLYISVHDTDGPSRARLMDSPRAANILAQLTFLAQNDIAFHCQIVLCPGFNDGAHLTKTLNDLAALYPHAQSVAIVPVGLTRHRKGLTHLDPVDTQAALSALEIIHACQQGMLDKHGTRFCFASDEMYLAARAPVPSYEEYEDFVQIENGVGLLRILEEDYLYWHEQPHEPPRPRKLVIATGVSAYAFLKDMIGDEPFPGVHVQFIPITNTFFGPRITVSGLMTGQDLLAQLKNIAADELLLPSSCLNAEGDLFLDDMTFADFKSAMHLPVTITGGDGRTLNEALLGAKYQS